VSNRNKLKVQTKLNNQSNKKATEKWFLKLGARLPTLTVGEYQDTDWVSVYINLYFP